jgi:hypothetical protein
MRAGPPTGIPVAVIPGGPAPQGAPGLVLKPPKKRHGCLISLAVLLGLLLLLAIGAFFLVRAMSEPQDLGVWTSEADFDSALAKIGVVWPELPAGADPADFERAYSGEQPMDVTLTESELSALMSYRHDQSYWPISDVQVDLTGGDTARMSAVVTYAGRDWPVVIAGSAALSGNELATDVTTARVGAVGVPERFLPMLSDALEEVVNARLDRIPGFSVDTAEATSQGVHVTGTIWETATYVPLP